MSKPGHEYSFPAPGQVWRLWALAALACAGIAMGVVLRSPEVALVFVTFGLAPIVVAFFWMRTFVRRLTQGDRQLQVETFSGATYVLPPEERVRGTSTNLGQLSYYILDSRSYGKVRFVVTDEEQKRVLVSVLGLVSQESV